MLSWNKVGNHYETINQISQENQIYTLEEPCSCSGIYDASFSLFSNPGAGG